MNLTKLAVLFIIICLPFSFIMGIRVKEVEQHNRIEKQYKEKVSNAVEDGVLALRQYTKRSVNGGNVKRLSVNVDEVIASFLASYDYGFGARSDSQKLLYGRYIVALVVVDYDGYYIYGTEAIMNDSIGQVEYKQVLSEKRPYLYDEGDRRIWMTLGDDITIVNRDATEGWVEKSGEYREAGMADLFPPSLSVDNYNDIRRYTITKIIETAIETTVRKHNDYTGNLGMNYTFHLPVYDRDAFGESLEDVSLLSFIQIPMKESKQVLELNGYNKKNVQSKDRYIGYEEVDLSGGSSTLYYCTSDCTHDHHNNEDDTVEDKIVKYFESSQEAAKEGYWPCYMVGK